MPAIVELLVSTRHRYDGRPRTLGQVPVDLVPAVEIRAGLGVVGDRYFNQPAHRDASVTVMAAESLVQWNAGLAHARRNILLTGVDVDAHIGQVLTLDSGDGPVRLSLRRPANPCRWMDVAVGPGALSGLRGRGGARCVPLTDGVLRVGPVSVQWSAAADDQPCQA